MIFLTAHIQPRLVVVAHGRSEKVTAKLQCCLQWRIQSMESKYAIHAHRKLRPCYQQSFSLVVQNLCCKPRCECFTFHPSTVSNSLRCSWVPFLSPLNVQILSFIQYEGWPHFSSSRTTAQY